MDMTVPTANPLTREPPQAVYVALVPGTQPTPGSSFTIVSGFESTEDDAVHRLSRVVLQLAMLNYIVAVTLRLIALVIALINHWYSQIVTLVLNVAFAHVVLYLGIRGVKTRNGQCCSCCCGPLTAFYVIYIILTIVEAFAVFVELLDGFVVLVLFDFAFLVLYAATAEQARRLLEALALLPERTSFDGPPPGPGTPPALVSQPTVAVAEATEVIPDKPPLPDAQV
mmetsp:Transcript_6213/g.18821  ORF Transcript_6213/g.18821 Transcript_6213/m.18821 type:complete len:226 (-) Transcript_6213:207-884(-)